LLIKESTNKFGHSIIVTMAFSIDFNQ